MQLTDRHRCVVAWLLLGGLAAAVCSLIWPAAHLGSEVIPVGNDSFYHARRILDTAADPSAFYEFDSHIHAPEGSLLVWPWGYDYVMGWIVRLGMQLGLAQEPIRMLVWIPVAAVFASVGLILLIARRLGLSHWSCVLAALCVAISPLTQSLHGTGNIDHHFAEYLFVLGMLATGLKWCADLQDHRAAAAAGIVLGLAPAIHNALFVLQLPMLLTLLVLWLQGAHASRRAAKYFAGALLICTVAILAPSLPVHEGLFAYYYLSWFHLYVAAGTASVCCFFAYRPCNRASALALATLAVLSLVPLGYQISLAGSFLSGALTRLDSISEMMSVPKLIRLYGPADAAKRYSLLVYLLPLTWICCAFAGWRERHEPRVFFWICAVCGLSLLFMQFRLHYFGSFALYLPWLIVAERLAAGRFAHIRKQVMLITSLLVVFAYFPALRYQLLAPLPIANDNNFANVHPMLQTLAKACAEDPGIVLADHDLGHLIRYYTDCSVIANNFLLTEQQGDKIREMERLLQTPASELPVIAPYVKYVLIRPAYITDGPQGIELVSYSSGDSRLMADLLLGPSGSPPSEPPPEYQLLHRARVRRNQVEIPYARLYKISSAVRTETRANTAQ